MKCLAAPYPEGLATPLLPIPRHSKLSPPHRDLEPIHIIKYFASAPSVLTKPLQPPTCAKDIPAHRQLLPFLRFSDRGQKQANCHCRCCINGLYTHPFGRCNGRPNSAHAPYFLRRANTDAPVQGLGSVLDRRWARSELVFPVRGA